MSSAPGGLTRYSIVVWRVCEYVRIYTRARDSIDVRVERQRDSIKYRVYPPVTAARQDQYRQHPFGSIFWGDGDNVMHMIMLPLFDAGIQRVLFGSPFFSQRIWQIF